MFWIGLGQAAAVVGALLGVRILTGLLAPEIYGRLALGMTAVSLVQVIVLGPLSNGATRFFEPARQACALASYLLAVKKLVGRASAGILVCTGLLCLGLLASGNADWIALVLAAVGFALVSGYNSVLNGMQNAARQRAVVALHQGLASWGRFLLAAAMVMWLGASSAVAMLGYALAIVVVLGSQGWFFRRALPSEDNMDGGTGNDHARWRADILAYAWPFVTWAVLEWAKLAAGRWGLQIFSTTREVGLYAVLYQLGYYPLMLLTQLATSFLAPIYFQRAGDGSDPARLRDVHRLGTRMTWAAIIGTFFVTAVAVLVHQPLFSVLVGEEYHSVSYLLPMMILGGGLAAATMFLTTLFQAGLRVNELIVPRVASEMLGLIGTIAGAAFFGVKGVVFANVLYAITSLLWIGLLFRRTTAKPVK